MNTLAKESSLARYRRATARTRNCGRIPRFAALPSPDPPYCSMPNIATEATQAKIVQLIAKELAVGAHQVAAAVTLLDEGATVPFIARYRKEATDNLDDTHLRSLEERLLYLRELEERRAVILASIHEQGKLTDELRLAIEAGATKQVLLSLIHI